MEKILIFQNKIDLLINVKIFIKNFFDNEIEMDNLIKLICKNYFKYILKKNLPYNFKNKKKDIRRIIPEILNMLSEMNNLDKEQVYKIINFPYKYLNKKNNNSSSF